MRRTFRLLASVKPARYLEAGTPTGLTGLYTHPSPRSTLLFLYSSTLDKLKTIPDHSVYRQSVEALTKHRMQIVESTVPPGYEEWAAKARDVLAAEDEYEQTRAALAAELKKTELTSVADIVEAPGVEKKEKLRQLRIQALRRLLEDVPEQKEESNVVLSASQGGEAAVRVERGGQTFFIRHLPKVVDQRELEWDGERDASFEGIRTVKEVKKLRETLEHALDLELKGKKWESPAPPKELEPEPQLTAEQISEIETKIGAGLIEEVVQVAESELKLVDVMLKAKVWESLAEQPAENQWLYFERKA